jgi:hypothetical protein
VGAAAAVEEMALSGATPRRDIHRLQWDAGKPLAAAEDLHAAFEADAKSSAAEHLGHGLHASAQAGAEQHNGGAKDPASGHAAVSSSQEAGLAARKQGLVGCGDSEQQPCGTSADLTVTLSAMEIRTFLVHLGDADAVPVFGYGGTASRFVDA